MHSFTVGCKQATPAFVALGSSDMAKCLSYTSSTIWAPTPFDSAVAACQPYASTPDADVYSTVMWERSIMGLAM